MRISVVALGRRGAGGPFSLELASHLAAHAQVSAVLAGQSEALAAWRSSGLDYQLVSTYQNTPQALLSYFQTGRFRAIAGLIRQQKPDVLLFPFFFTWNPFIQTQLPDLPSVITVHDPAPHPGLTSRAYQYLEDWSIRRAARFLLLSEGLRPALVRRGATEGRIDHIPHGGLSGYYQGRPGALPRIPGQPFTLLFFGRITPYKGLEVLLKAYRQLAERYRLRLLVVGAGDLSPYQAALKDLPGVEVINEWIRDEKLDHYFSQADLLVLPYTSASQSGVLATAAGYALPVLATRTGGIPEQIIEGETGLLVEPGSAEELARAIEMLSRQPELLKKLGRNLQKDYQDNRNWAKISALVYESCGKAVSERRR
jgi:glycosyltransferase involved in cell wall biosynthesis